MLIGLDLTGGERALALSLPDTPSPGNLRGAPLLNLPMDRIPPYHGVCCGAFLAGAFFFLSFYVSWLNKHHIWSFPDQMFLENVDIW